MTKKEIKSVFGVDHNNVPNLEYEVVPVYHTLDGNEKKSAKSMNFKAFKRNYTLQLQKNDGVLIGSETPIYIARISPKNESAIIYEKMKFPLPKDLKLYHDVHERSSIITHKGQEDNRLHINGIIEDGIHLRSLPSRVHEKVIEYKKKFEPNFKSVLHSTRSPLTYHVAIKSNYTYKPKQYKSFKSSSAIQNYFGVHTQGRIKRHSDIPPIIDNTVYPKILVTLDYEYYQLFHDDVNELAKYMIAFWNGVDLKFRSMFDPEVRLNVAGFILPKEPKAVYYMIENHRHSGTILTEETVESIGRYFKHMTDIPHENYDVIVGLTNRNLTDSTYIDPLSEIKGIAQIAGTCFRGLNAAVLVDAGLGTGIHNAAHELAHTFDVHHDGPEAEEASGENCDWNDGYIMSYKRKNTNFFYWSNCSIVAMQKFFNDPSRSACVRHKPNPGKLFPSIYPGHVVSRNKQCLRYTDDKKFFAEKSSQSNCMNLTCIKYYPDIIMYRHVIPLDGTYCGEGKSCFGGECIFDVNSNQAELDPADITDSSELPGKIFTRNRQCQFANKSYYSESGDIESAADCKNLICTDGEENIKLPYPLEDGSFCGPRQICYAGACVPDLSAPELKFPDKVYSREEQCQEKSSNLHAFKASTYAFLKYEHDCSFLRCIKVINEKGDTVNFGTTRFTYPPVDGTYCGKGKACFDGYCIDNEHAVYEPNKGKNWEHLPGRFFSRNNQCYFFMRQNDKSPTNIWKSNEAMENVCSHLSCEFSATPGKMQNMTFPPVDGTPCGKKRICFDGECVEDKKPTTTTWSKFKSFFG
ncbi:uncharacterized protein LOC111694187 [Trichogramma pretiosum]|uniref:uncharacterized protein LOC111694187 n=1 Tax=Trichogramma pretiosum TaxID=7493 RepID=UPI000C718FBA|nr:uncharacterized protein LOC111694187 [Trichogramma pretiosum]